ncbi:hypothetical protein [Caulobacter sp. 17J65-9]|uniref:hypothetical protein n=1 Tax=Caulobacter sp. 17J65-9 TaxID=2709382 RepID=UPI0013CA0FAB|nr:hypothetical protein [Caulobacter sp. 17J65-9]NEX95220.1 hypothetical protein [Caulobacter sp. 17J65-9]
MSLVQYPIVVRPAGGLVWFCTICVILLAAGAIAFHVWNLSAPEPSPTWLTLVIAVGLSLFAVYALLSAGKSAVRLHADRIEVVGVFRTAVRRFSDITGVRQGGDAGFVLVAREGVRSLMVPKYVTSDAAVVDWLNALPYLDMIEAQAAQAELARDARLGATEAERLKNLQRLRRVGQVLNVGGYALGAWLLFWPRPYEAAVYAALAAPALAFALAFWRPGLFILVERGRIEMRAHLWGLLLAPAGALAVRALTDVQLVEQGPALMAAALATLVGLAVATAADERARTRIGVVFLVMILFPWAWGGGVLMNMLLDQTPPRLVPAVVEAHGGEAHDDPALSLRAEGRLYEDLDVSGERWTALRDGDHACLVEFKGRFGWRHVLAGGTCDGGPVLPIVPVDAKAASGA